MNKLDKMIRQAEEALNWEILRTRYRPDEVVPVRKALVQAMIEQLRVLGAQQITYPPKPAARTGMRGGLGVAQRRIVSAMRQYGDGWWLPWWHINANQRQLLASLEIRGVVSRVEHNKWRLIDEES